jgi:multisubunit Na+/H+ antiporter MnhF subunit
MLTVIVLGVVIQQIAVILENVQLLVGNNDILDRLVGADAISVSSVRVVFVQLAVCIEYSKHAFVRGDFLGRELLFADQFPI